MAYCYSDSVDKPNKFERKAPRVHTINDMIKNNRTIKMLWEFTKGSRFFLVLSFAFAILNAFSHMLTPQVIRASVDYALGGETPDYPEWIMNAIDSIGGFSYIGNNMWIMALAALAAGFLMVIAQMSYRVTITKATEGLIARIRDKLFNHIEHLPYNRHMKNRTGDILQRCTYDVDIIKRFFANQLAALFRISLLLLFSLYFMFNMNVIMTLAAIIPIPLILWRSVRFYGTMRRGFAQCDEEEGVLNAKVQENLTGVRVVRAFGKEIYEKEHFEQFNEYYTSLWVKLAKKMGWFWSGSDFISYAQVMIIIVFGAILCVKGKLSAGEYMAFLSYNHGMIMPVRRLGRMLSEMSKVVVSGGRINEVLDMPAEADAEGAGECDMHGDVEFKNVTFSFTGDKNAIENLSFTAKAGTTLGILGATGSGKSTIIQLLDKIYPLPQGQGTITIGGKDISEVKTSYVRGNIGVVIQEPYLFSRTLKENIAIAGDVNDIQSIENVASDACLTDMISNLTDGYETFVGERGVTLSGGQKQRVAIARTLIQKTPILIFDDSLSAVDTETDARIRTAIEKRFGSALVIIISHRITTLSKADKIIVLEKGHLAEEGTHEELKRAGGFYQQVYEFQKGTQEEMA